MVKHAQMPSNHSGARKHATAAVELLPNAANSTLSDEAIEMAVKSLLAQGVKLEDIVMPGSGADAILFIADDFDAPIADFDDYT